MTDKKRVVADHIDQILEDRGQNYGDYATMSECIIKLQSIIIQYSGLLTDSQQHALDMIMVKIGRILTGDPNYIDNWRDIEGYARLVRERLE